MVNEFKKNIREQAQIGLWLGMANIYAAEIAATAGFDWLLIDGEHAPNDVRSILAQLQAIAPYRSHPVVRPVAADPVHIKQLLDIGAQTLLVPMVETAEQAQQMVRATRYPPEGFRGVGAALARASRWGAVPNYVAQADQEICLLLQVESAAALEQLDAIAQVKGVDGVFIGPADLSASMGHRGNPGHPQVQAAIEDAIARIQRAGKAAGILTTNETLAKRYLQLGCKFVAAGIDTTLFAAALRNLAACYKN